MVEDIITALSRIRWLFVIARNSSFTYKGRAVDVKQVGRELGVRYVLEGSVRKAANRVRITGQLDRCDDRRRISGPSASKARSTTSSSCRTRSRRASSARSRRSSSAPRSSAPSASRPKASMPTTITCAAWRASIRDAGEAIDEALALFPQGDRARSGICLGLWHGGVVPVLAQDQWLDDRSARGSSPRARDWPAAPSSSGKNDAVALTRGGHALAHFGGDLDSGVALLDRALVLNPNLAAAWFLGGFLRIWPGRADEPSSASSTPCA